MPAKSPFEVLLWYPNIIGYLRIACMWTSFVYLSKRDADYSGKGEGAEAVRIANLKGFLIFYLAAFAGDLVDGFVARAFDQCEHIHIYVCVCV